ncbi:MAG: hypothetical protein LBT74_12015 [Acidobacteriota bacterium]|nr:hypothetical protein [Acidobacteriota bacterium]
MYQFRPISERMQRLHRRIRDRVIQTDAERALIMTESYKKYGNAVPAIRRPKALYDICAQMTLRVEDEDVLVCNMGKNFCGCAINPDYGGIGWIPYMIRAGVWTLRDDGLYHNPDTEEVPLTMAPEDYEAFCSIEEFWKGKTYTDIANGWTPDGYDELARLRCTHAVPGALLVNLPAGHLTPGYRKIVDTGYAAIRKEAQDWLDAHRNNIIGDEMEKYLFYESAVIVCDAAHVLATRYADACLEKAEGASDPARRRELEEMADGLRWIADNPARGFREACQAELLYIQLILMSGIGDVGSCGRFDQVTGKYLEKDLAAGRITLDQAQEVVDNFFLDISRNWGAMVPELVKIIGVGNTYMHTTIGGVDPVTGKDASNAVTYMVLEAVGRMGLHDPTITLRLTKDTPEKLLECAIETTKLAGGLPLYYNDEVVVPAMQKELGFTLEEARDYALIGCQEITGSGIEYACCNGIAPPHGSVYYSVVLDMAINNGKNPMNGEQASVQTGYLYDMESMEDVKAAFVKMARYILKAHISINNFMEYVFAYNTPHAILSISIADCMERGKDVIAGGARYNSFGGTGTGLATVADSLSTIEYACFDKKICTTRELYDAVMANWEGYEDLRQKLLGNVPHFGNNDPYADKWMTWVTHTYYDLCQEMSSKYAKYYRAGLYGAADHVGQGYVTWATPDGRLAGTPIADAASPVQSRDVNGPTAVLNSSCCYDHGKFMDGVCLNLRIHPSALSREDGNKKLGSMIKAYMGKGGAEVQFNVVSSETMRAAQKNPDEYRNLVVRIAGYSAYFVELSTDCQNDLITRTENVV